MKQLRLKIALLAIVFIGAMTNVFAQPPNDVCSGAFPVTPDGTCYGPGLPQTTTAGAGDHWVGTVGCQSGNHNEVWFSFTATNSQLDVTVTAGTMTGNIEFILVASTGPCTGLGLAGSLCGPSVLTGTISGLQIGTTYYYTISTDGTDGTFTTCVDNVAPTPVPGQDCSVAAILCDGSGFSQGTSSAGFGAQEVSTSNSCWGSGGERQSKWFKFTIGCSGTLEFNINPVTHSNDYDWGLWDVTSDLTCGSKGNTIACNWSGCDGSTGTSSCPASEPNVSTGGSGCFGGPAAWNAPVNVTAGNTYALLVDNFTTSNSGFSLTFGGACATGTAVIGPDANFTGSIDATCMIFTGTKDCPTANSTYLWNYGDGNTSTGMNGSHTYLTTGTYTVSYQVTDALGCIATTSQTFNIGCIPLPIELLDFRATESQGIVDLAWETKTEVNNDYFTVEKSKDGVVFEVVEIIDGAGNSTQVQEYGVTDKNPYTGTSYYRLKQTDYDGVSSFSNVIPVEIKRSFNALNIMPNPVKGNGTISFESAGSWSTEIQVFDVSGRLIMQKNVNTIEGLNTIELETSELVQGMYFLILSNEIDKKTIRFTKY